MYRPGEFVPKDAVHQALSFHPAAFGKSGGHDFHPEMGLALGPGPYMPGMQVRFVDDVQGSRVERVPQFCFDCFGNRHMSFFQTSDFRVGIVLLGTKGTSLHA